VWGVLQCIGGGGVFYYTRVSYSSLGVGEKKTQTKTPSERKMLFAFGGT